MVTRTLLLLAFVTGCQCGAPLVEGPDSGTPDSGGPGPTFPSCVAPGDCTGTPQVTAFCASGGFSCIAGKCVAVCSNRAGETCDVGADHCLVCPADGGCIPPSCSSSSFAYHVEQIACSGTAPLAVQDAVQENAARTDAGECGARFALADGGTLGHLYLQSARGLSFESALLGGACLASELPTGASRILIECPRCQIVLGP